MADEGFVSGGVAETGVVFTNPAPTSFVFGASGGKMLFSIGPDGTITRGPAFTTDDEMSLVFWQKIADAFPRFLRDSP